MSKLLSQGGFGCVYYPGIKCDGNQEKREFVSKLQINDYTAVNEVKIGEIIKTIPDFQFFFIPIIDYCKINISQINQNLIEKCNTLHNRDKLVLMKMNYISNESFYDLFLVKNKKVIFSSIIEKYMYLLNSIDMLNKKNIVHFDLKDENILINKKNKNPLIIDFGISLDMRSFNYSKLDDYFYVFAPEYYIWSFEIHIICFLSKNVKDDQYKLKKNDIERIANDFVENNKALYVFSNEFIDDYRGTCIEFGETLVDKSKKEIINLLTKKEVYQTWDNYSLSCLILKTFKYLFDNNYSSIDLFKNIIEIVLINIHPDSNKRLSVSNTVEKLDNILNNVSDSQDSMSMFIENIDIKKDKIDILLKKDNESIQKIKNTSENNITLS